MTAVFIVLATIPNPLSNVVFTIPIVLASLALLVAWGFWLSRNQD